MMAEEAKTFDQDASNPMAIEGTQSLTGLGEVVVWLFVPLITLRYGRRWWLLFQGVVVTGIAALTLVSPQFSFGTVMGMLIGEYDNCHNFLIRAYSVLYLLQGIRLLKYRNSTDKRGVSSILEGYFVVYALEMICHPLLIAGMEKHVGKLQHNPEKGYPFFLGLMLGNFVHVVAGDSGYNDFKTPSACNSNARFDALALFLIGASLYAFPKESLALMTTRNDFDTAQVVAMSVVGCYTIGNSIVSLQAESFTQDNIRRNMYLVRIIECVSLSALVLLYWAFTDNLTTHSLWAVPMYGILAANAYMAMTNVPAKIKE